MALYLIGMGLNKKGITAEGLETLGKCRKIYLEGYTVDFPYKIEELEKELKKKIKMLNRTEVESERLVKEAKKENIALLIYGCPLFATTHTTIIMDAMKAKVDIKVIYSASVFDAVASTGLQLYKFGKITSMPKWQKGYEPDSFLDIVAENRSIKAHSLILTDIGLALKDALGQLRSACEKKNLKIDNIVVCSRLGTEKAEVYYEDIEKLEGRKISLPFCIIIPSEMHFLEKEMLESIKI